MNRLRALLLRMAGLWSNGRREQEFAAEIESHLQMQIDDNLRAGMTAEEARREAVLKLGGVEQTKQAYRERSTVPPLESVLHDVRYSLRQWKKNPGFAVTAAAVLALGIGASTAIFSAVNPILFRPLPYPEARRIMMVWESRREGSPLDAAFGTFQGLSERTRSFESLAVMKPWQPAMIGNREPERLEGQQVSSRYFRTLGVAPALGRDFTVADDQYHGPKVIILSDSLWRRAFAAEPAIVGRQITLDDNSYTVIGVMPRAFENVLSATAQIWAPLQYDPALPVDGREWGHHLQMIGRLRAGVSREQAQNESTTIFQQLGQTYAQGYDNSGGPSRGALVYGLQDDLTRDVRPVLLAILGGVVLVLVIACVNVVNLMLARGAQRRAEFAMRSALGASRRRLLQQLLTESMMLAFVGGALGIVLANVGVQILLALSPPDLPRLHAIRVDGMVLAFAVGITTLVGIIVGLVPALQASHNDPQSGLQSVSRTSTRHQQRTRRVLVIAEVAIALVLLVSAGLLLRSIRKLFAIPPGFDPSHLLTLQVQEYGRAADSDAASARFFEQALQAVRDVPGVESAAFTSQLPLSGEDEGNSLQFESYPSEKAIGAFRYEVSPSYFETMHIPLVYGRALSEHDDAKGPGAVLISETLAKRLFPKSDAIGQRVHMGPDLGRADAPWHTVVGVVGDVKQWSLALNEGEAFYVTPTQWAWVDSTQSLIVRSHGDPATLAPAIRSAVWSVNKDEVIVRMATMDDLVAKSEAQRHFALVLFEAFALAGLLLAATGIYGVLSGSVTERTREIGVRAALGASPDDILKLVLRQGLKLASIGAAIGLAGALASSRALTTLLYQVSPGDPVTYIEVTAALLAVAVLACWIPARRAAHVDPAITLKAE
jgi:putative ABC transport system permease protein